MADLTKFSLRANGFTVEVVDTGLVATTDGDGYAATTPCYIIILNQLDEGIAFTRPDVAFICHVDFVGEDYWVWTDALEEATLHATALAEQDIINLIDYDIHPLPAIKLAA